MNRFERPTVQQQHFGSDIRQNFQGGRDVGSLQSTVQAALPNSALAVVAPPAPSHTYSTQSAACQTPAGPPVLPVSPANMNQAFTSSTHSMASMTKFVYMFWACKIKSLLSEVHSKVQRRAYALSYCT